MQVRNHDCHLNYNYFYYNNCTLQEFFTEQFKKKINAICHPTLKSWQYDISVITVTVHKI